jgi:hypothetical protein
MAQQMAHLENGTAQALRRHTQCSTDDMYSLSCLLPLLYHYFCPNRLVISSSTDPSAVLSNMYMVAAVPRDFEFSG